MPVNPQQTLAHIHDMAEKIGRHIRLMEVCGTHTHAIGRGGLRTQMPPSVELVSGPGCPVCVTSQSDVERMLLLGRVPGVTVCTFGDMLRVPGLDSSLEKERAAGADIRVVYSALNALELAQVEPGLQVVFLAVGFETTSPGVASTVLRASELGLSNFSIYISHKLIVPAMRAVLTGQSQIDGFLTPGHVSVIIGSDAYQAAAMQYKVPCVATGFGVTDVLEGIAMLLDLIANHQAGSFIQYTRAVKTGGNRRAWDMLMSVFDTTDAEWRGLGVIPDSGLALNRCYRDYDAADRYQIPRLEPDPLSICRCGDVLKGLIHPPQCPLFKRECTPRTPVGPCMVSSEGACAARYKYG